MACKRNNSTDIRGEGISPAATDGGNPVQACKTSVCKNAFIRL